MAAPDHLRLATDPAATPAASAASNPTSKGRPNGCSINECSACPCNSASTDRVKPHPGHGIPVIRWKIARHSHPKTTRPQLCRSQSRNGKRHDPRPQHFSENLASAFLQQLEHTPSLNLRSEKSTDISPQKLLRGYVSQSRNCLANSVCSPAALPDASRMRSVTNRCSCWPPKSRVPNELCVTTAPRVSRVNLRVCWRPAGAPPRDSAWMCPP